MDLEILITNINTVTAFTDIKSAIGRFLPRSEITLDLDDVDRVLKGEAEQVDSQKIIESVKKFHFDCNKMTH